jgi:hypothetical protein
MLSLRTKHLTSATLLMIMAFLTLNSTVAYGEDKTLVICDEAGSATRSDFNRLIIKSRPQTFEPLVLVTFQIVHKDWIEFRERHSVEHYTLAQGPIEHFYGNGLSLKIRRPAEGPADPKQNFTGAIKVVLHRSPVLNIHLICQWHNLPEQR